MTKKEIILIISKIRSNSTVWIISLIQNHKILADFIIQISLAKLSWKPFLFSTYFCIFFLIYYDCRTTMEIRLFDSFALFLSYCLFFQLILLLKSKFVSLLLVFLVWQLNFVYIFASCSFMAKYLTYLFDIDT